MTASSTQAQTAIVIGASMAGLLAARALAQSFDQVLIVERDALPAFDDARRAGRKGVPQGNQPHLLLARGHETLEALFPGFTRQILELGGEQIDVGEGILWYQYGSFYERRSTGFNLLLASRLAIEAVIRQRVLELPNVRLFDGVSVRELLHTPDCSRVTGVRIEGRPDAGRSQDEISAGLVVDATGRGSRMPAWLEAMGYPTPEEQRVEVKVTYASRYYERLPGELDGNLGLVIAPDVGRPMFGLLLAQEGNAQAPLRWQLCLGGLFGNAPGPSDQDYLDFARGFPRPEIYNLIKDRPPLTPIQWHKFPASRRLRYDRLARFPHGLLVFGDAIASVNPAYGQGMTISALEAQALQECLQDGAADLAQRFFKKAAALIETAWVTAVGADLNYPQAQARRTAFTRLMSWYMDRLLQATHRDHDLRVAFFKVTNLINPPQTLFSPGVVARVFSRF